MFYYDNVLCEHMYSYKHFMIANTDTRAHPQHFSSEKLAARPLE